MREELSRGAEGVLYVDVSSGEERVVKERVRKGYRHSVLDERLRKARTRREGKVLSALGGVGARVPKLFTVDDKSMRIEMEKINGVVLREVLREGPEEYGFLVGEQLALLHNHNVIHGDLTTSNILVCEGGKENDGGSESGCGKQGVCFIDFGLSVFSSKVEDKAVDVHLFFQSLLALHEGVYGAVRAAFLKGYCGLAKGEKLVLKRLETVEGRGRNKKK